MSSLEHTTLLNSWELSSKTIAVLEKEPEIVHDLANVRLLPSFPKSYIPQVFEVCFDDVTFIRYERGKTPYFHPCSSDYNPPFTEYRFDGETALFHVDGEIVVDRTQNLNLEQIRQSFQ
ncbi:MAG: hypothetical protein HC820_04050 [Hydrococcus sp. RM1_1_31]|nr:hypothetical protein [Hydrococcus sp. RM1_1_31]